MSRLQKLLNLLENGTSDATRKAAAKQIADVTKSHPEQLPSVLRQVHGCLYSKSWEARVAAGEAIGHLAEAFPHHSVQDLAQQSIRNGENPKTVQEYQATDMIFKPFNLQAILEKGTPLVASGGQEYDMHDDAGLTPKQRIEKQKKQLKKRLGLDRTMENFMDTDELFGDEDLESAGEGAASSSGGGPGGSSRQANGAQRQQATELLLSMEGLSARERNKLKRKVKALGRADSVKSMDGMTRARSQALSLPKASPLGPAGGPSAPAAAALGTPATATPTTPTPTAVGSSSDAESAETDAEEWKHILGGGWPFQRLCDQLCVDVLDPVWEVRHGAAVALREVLRTHASCAGVEAPVADETSGWCMPGDAGKRALNLVSPEIVGMAAEANRQWLEDAIIMLLCMLALDRFGDYGSDQVTAPVRETAAQALGMALQPLGAESVGLVLGLLQQLMSQSEWDVRYAGYLGIKYLLAGRADLGPQLLPKALPALMRGLQDADDDVRAASADALVPVASTLVEFDALAVASVRQLLWSLLEQLEELSPATMSVMQLLAQLYAHAGGAGDISDELVMLVPRLWPFLRHSLSTVRLSTMQCLERLLSASLAQASTAWLQPLLGAMLRLAYQNLLLEGDARIQQATLRVWRLLLACCSPEVLAATATAAAVTMQQQPLLHVLLLLAATASGHPLDTALMVMPLEGKLVAVGQPEGADAQQAGGAKRLKTAFSAVASGPSGAAKYKLVVGSLGDGSAVCMRMLCSQALGQLCCKMHGKDNMAAASEVLTALSSPSAMSHLIAAAVLWHWLAAAGSLDGSAANANGSLPASDTAAVQTAAAPPANSMLLSPAGLAAASAAALALPGTLLSKLHELLAATSASHPHAPSSAEPYAEASVYYVQMRREVLALVSACMQTGWLLHTPNSLPIEALLPEHVLAMLTMVPVSAEGEGSPVPIIRARLQTAATSLQAFEQYLHMGALALGAAAAIRFGQLPPKLNQIIQPLMNTVRKEPEHQLQAVAASAVAELMVLCASRTPCPNDKILRNVCAMAWGDPTDTPSAAEAAAAAELQQLEERKQSHTAAGPRGTTAATAAAAAAAAATAAAGVVAGSGDSPAAHAATVSRLGAEAVLRSLCHIFGMQLWSQLPLLWELVSKPEALLEASMAQQATGAVALQVDLQAAINSLTILRIVAPHVVPELVPSLVSLLPCLCSCSRHPNSAVRSASARCLAAVTSAWTAEVMPPLLRLLVPLLNSSDDNTRLGAVETVAQLVSQLGIKLVAYTLLLLVPLLKRMSDVSAPVRLQATTCFGSLVALLPLAQGVPSPPGLDSEQLATVSQDSTFLLQLLDNKRVEDYALPFPLAVTLRPYQQEGINWLAFLRRFGLHGVLADDMGLGKTLQASAIMAAALVEQSTKYQQTLQSEDQPRPCLVVCPATLTSHWAFEICRFVCNTLRPLNYSGSPNDRAQMQALLSNVQQRKGTAMELAYNVVVMSYESLRADVDWVASINWLYCVLDEGHIIKSPKSKITQACKRVPATHRLILSGTPIQNNVIELWSLFDFLMPGFLGPEKDFNTRYGKALQAAKYSKRGSRESEAGLLAVEALHKQVMPFVLRRTKAQVLQDLPPKIVQDVYCELSPLQRRLYEDFQQSQALHEVSDALSKSKQAAGEQQAAAPHVFQSLQYMRKLCSHPLLVLDWKVPEHRQAVQDSLGVDTLRGAEEALHQDVAHAPKLLALRDLLAQCGVGRGLADSDENEAEEDGSSAGHRLLVFAQLKSMLDLVERDVLLPAGVSFLRLDGSTDASSRFGIVQKFNSDPTIDVLLLTTAVGGLGLNLTSADTVVFLEHDWNPMRDLQAMDRAHRLGQTRTVNVYRLLMRNTLEEKVMGLQQFKLEVANAVVNQDNFSLKSMDTTQLLDLFSAAPAPAGAAAGAAAAPGAATAAGQLAGASAAASRKQSGLQAVLAGLGELWDESQYESEFSLGSFMKKISKVPPQE